MGRDRGLRSGGLIVLYRLSIACVAPGNHNPKRKRGRRLALSPPFDLTHCPSLAYASGYDFLAPHTYRLKESIAELPLLEDSPVKTGWLVTPIERKAAVYRTGAAAAEIALDNGLIRRTFRLAPNAATVGLDILTTGQSVLRGVKPEALVTIAISIGCCTPTPACRTRVC